MIPLKSILVGVDFTSCSAAALRQAIRIARFHHATLRVVHILDSHVVADMKTAFPGVPEAELHARFIQGVRRNWEQFTAAIDGAEQLEIIVKVDHPAAGLLKLTSEFAADLLVLGTHGTSPPDRGAGTTAIACARRSRAMVLLVHDSDGQAFRSVLACVDFSETSRKALELAAAFAQLDRARLHVLHVFDAPWNQLHYRTETTEASLDFQKQYTDGLMNQLQRLTESINGATRELTIGFHLVDYGSHGAGIVKFARENNIDLVVLGTRGRTNLRDLIMGSTAERVLRETPCSILAVKAE